MARLLVVDDEAPARTTLALLLRKRGHHVAEADDVTSATKRLAEEVFELVVTDLRMPDGDGLDVLQAARATRPFVAVNCGAVPETLLESELFGHVRGAFTGAAGTKLGLFEEADGGTLFLDEIAEMPASLQVTLLRALQSREVRRLGATQATTIDVRVIAATNGDLAKRIADGSFREDLFYRLNVIQVMLPPLRDRREDIPALAEHFLARAATKLGRTLRLSPDALERLLRYPWPGNVRELENAIERATILARTESVEPDDLPPHVSAGLQLGPSPALPRQISLAEAERAHILQTLERFGRNHSGAAEALGIGRTTLWRKLKEYGIDR